MVDLTIPEAIELALSHHRAGRLAEAESIYCHILVKEPKNPDALHLLGVLTHQNGRDEFAEELMRNALDQRGDIAEYHADLAAVLGDQGRWEGAVEEYRIAVSLASRSAQAHVQFAHALRKMGRLQEAMESYRTALALQPEFPAAHNNLGNLLQQMGRLDEAIAAYCNAIAHRPNYLQALSNLASALLEKDQPQDAARLYAQAMQLDASVPELHNNLGKAFRDLGEVDQAIESFRRAIALRSDYADAHWNLALMLLLQGDFAEGWAQYEWRWRVAEFPSPMRGLSQPLWDGRELNGARILLYGEQGFGDAIQFVRYMPLVAARGGRIILECPAALVRLFQTLPHVEQVVAAGDAPPAFDWQCPLLSLPHILGTTIDAIPAPIGYLSADASLVEHWRGKISSEPGVLNVGLAWAGNPLNRNDRRRSLALRDFAPLAQIKNVRFHSLQKGPPAEQTRAASSGIAVADWSADLNDFADTAALIANLDLVISVDTAPAHLAAAMGVAVWVLIPFAPDPRWLLDRDDSPWYPTMRLFRQSKAGDWNSVMRTLVQDLQRLRQMWNS